VEDLLFLPPHLKMRSGSPSSRLGRARGARTRGYGRRRCTTKTTVQNGRISTQALYFSAT